MKVEISQQRWPSFRELMHRVPDLPEADAMAVCVNMSSQLWLATIDGMIACVWGLIPPTVLSKQAYLWLYTNELADEHPFLLVRWSQRMIEEMLKEFDQIVGHCKVDARRSIRWLKWLGATFGEPDGRKISFKITRRKLHG